MKNAKVILIALMVTGLTACATQPVVSEVRLKERLAKSNVRVTPIGTPVQLTERTKSQAVGNFVLASVVSSVAGSGGNAGNMQQLQANMQITQAFGQQLNQALPDNYAVDAGKGVDLALAKKISDYFSAAAPADDKTQELYISVSASRWELGYTSFLTSQDYDLSYGLHLGIQEKLGDQLQPVTTISCAGVAKDKMPLEAWQADNYKNVNTAAEFIVNECYKQFMTSLGIPATDKVVDGSSHAQLQNTDNP